MTRKSGWKWNDGPVLVCSECQKSYRVPLSRSKSTYCSIACRAISKGRQQKSLRKKKMCLFCGKSMSFSPSVSKDRLFCSDPCYTSFQKTKDYSGTNSKRWRRVQKSCERCGKEFIAKGDRVDKGQGRFCSQRCWGVWARCHMPRKDTRIEIAMAELLDRLGIAYERERDMDGVCVADFYIPAKRLVVQCDGDYWHRLPRMVQKDKRQDSELIKLGYEILRFWEKDIHERLDECGTKVMLRVAA